MSLQDDIKMARLTHSMETILGTKKRVLVCPLPTHIHHSNTPSFSVFWSKGVHLFQCHGNCGLKGDVIDLVGYMRVSGYDPKSPKKVREALALLDNRYQMEYVVPVLEQTLNGDEWEDFYPAGEEVLAYAATRGLTAATLEKFKVGQDRNWMTMPAFEEGRLIGIKMRNLGQEKMRFMQYPGSHQTLFNYDTVKYAQSTIFLMKGEIPCMLMDQHGFLACAPTGGEGGWKEDWRTVLALAKVIVIGDNDATGVKYAEQRAAFLHGEVKFPPSEFKDWDEWLLADEQNCLQTTRSWIRE